MNQIRTGDWLAAVNYYQITETDPLKVTVRDITGGTLTITNDIVARECWSADRYEREEKCCRTVIAKKLLGAGDKAFTVNFVKKDGSERTLRGYLRTLNEQHTVLGMVAVVDLDVVAARKSVSAAHRLVTFSAVNWLILDSVKYVVK